MSTKNIVKIAIASTIIMTTTTNALAMNSFYELDHMSSEQLRQQLSLDQNELSKELDQVDQLTKMIDYASSKNKISREIIIYRVSSVIMAYALAGGMSFFQSPGHSEVDDMIEYSKQLGSDLEHELKFIVKNLRKELLQISQKTSDEKQITEEIWKADKKLMQSLHQRFEKYSINDLKALNQIVHDAFTDIAKHQQEFLKSSAAIESRFTHFDRLYEIKQKATALAERRSWTFRAPILFATFLAGAYSVYRGFINDKSALEKQVDQETTNMSEEQLLQYLDQKERDSLALSLNIEKIEDEITYIKVKLN